MEVVFLEKHDLFLFFHLGTIGKLCYSSPLDECAEVAGINAIPIGHKEFFRADQHTESG